mmetsp:Transcript_14/g.25  ORF Transcript_14/g.25 Transcript_14/m.25 type:complete len:357 (+) Transcript_14:69-1139(+)
MRQVKKSLPLARWSAPRPALASGCASFTTCRQLPAQQTPLQRRSCASSSASLADESTQLGRYLESCGATWGEPMVVHNVETSEDGTKFTWKLDLDPQWLHAIRPGDIFESPPFDMPTLGQRARLQFFPKGDVHCKDRSNCSIWLCTDAPPNLQMKMRIGDVERTSGSSDFCNFEDAIRDGSIVIHMEVAPPSPDATPQKPPVVHQSLQLQGLEVAEWRLFNAADLLRSGQLVTSPPFRFHHVLLGDMYLELLPREDLPGHCAVFFRCRVPTMRLGVKLEDSSGAFCKTFESIGKSSPEDDLKASRFLGINAAAPRVIQPDGSLTIRATLEQVVAIPGKLAELMPRLDERVHWPKRL